MLPFQQPITESVHRRSGAPSEECQCHQRVDDNDNADNDGATCEYREAEFEATTPSKNSVHSWRV